MDLSKRAATSALASLLFSLFSVLQCTWEGHAMCYPPSGSIVCAHISASQLHCISCLVTPYASCWTPDSHSSKDRRSNPAPFPTAQSQRQTEQFETTHLAGMVTSLGVDLSSKRLMRIKYWVILVRRCLFLWTRNLGQCARWVSTCSNACGQQNENKSLGFDALMADIN
jgi:hypothetical protein